MSVYHERVCCTAYCGTLSYIHFTPRHCFRSVCDGLHWLLAPCSVPLPKERTHIHTHTRTHTRKHAPHHTTHTSKFSRWYNRSCIACKLNDSSTFVYGDSSTWIDTVANSSIEAHVGTAPVDTILGLLREKNSNVKKTRFKIKVTLHCQTNRKENVATDGNTESIMSDFSFNMGGKFTVVASGGTPRTRCIYQTFRKHIPIL